MFLFLSGFAPESREWEKVDVEKAYLDAEECRADKVIPKMLKVYSEVFKW